MSLHKFLANKNFVRLRKYSNVLVITIPSHLVDSLGWVEDDFCFLSQEGKKLVAQKAKVEIKCEVAKE